MNDLDAAYEEYKKWSHEHGYEHLDRELYEKVTEVKISLMQGILEGYRKLCSPGVTFSDTQKQMIQENIKKEQE